MFAESVSANCQMSQVVQQWIPHQWASHRESLLGKCTLPWHGTSSSHRPADGRFALSLPISLLIRFVNVGEQSQLKLSHSLCCLQYPPPSFTDQPLCDIFPATADKVCKLLSVLLPKSSPLDFVHTSLIAGFPRILENSGKCLVYFSKISRTWKVAENEWSWKVLEIKV